MSLISRTVSLKLKNRSSEQDPQPFEQVGKRFPKVRMAQGCARAGPGLHSLSEEWTWSGPAGFSGACPHRPLSSVGSFSPRAGLYCLHRLRLLPGGTGRWSVTEKSRVSGGVRAPISGGDESGVPGEHLTCQSPLPSPVSLPSTSAAAAAPLTLGKPGWEAVEHWT